jgi:TolB-like protein
MEDMMKASWNAHARSLRRYALWMVVLMLLTVVVAQAQTLDEAVAVYNNADYEKASTLFAAIAKDDLQTVETRKQALMYSGRAAIAQSEMDKARQAVTDLLELQPPLIELDPDVEAPPLMDIYYEVRGQMEVPKADPGMRTIAVMDFRNYALDEYERWNPMQWGLSSMMIEQLSGATDLKLVDRENLNYILKELDLQSAPGRVDQETAVRMGKLMGAHAMVFGGLYIIGKDMRLTARVVKVETGEILLGESVEGKYKDFSKLMEELSLKVAQSVNSDLTETEVGNRTETR